MSPPARLMVKCLESEGVSVVFGLPGEENIRFVRAMAELNIRYVLTQTAHPQDVAMGVRNVELGSHWKVAPTVPIDT